MHFFTLNWIESHIMSNGKIVTFARKFSNIDFFLRLLPLKVDDLLTSEM